MATLSWTPSQGPSLILRGAACKLWARASLEVCSRWSQASRTRRHHDFRAEQLLRLCFRSVPTSIASSKLGAARSGPPGPTRWVLSAPVRGGVGGTAGSWEGGSGDASQGSGPAQARAPTLPSGPSPEGCGLGSAHPLKNRRLDSLYTPQTHKRQAPSACPHLTQR